MPKSFSKTFVALDLETTDLDPIRGEIIEVGAARIRNGKVQETFSMLLAAKKPLSYLVSDLTGIRNEDLVGQPTFAAIKDELAQFIGDYPLIGHNLAFDLNFLRANGLGLNNTVFDTWHLATILFPEWNSHSLQSIVAQLGITAERSHRALDDAQQSAELFYVLFEKLTMLAQEDIADVLSFLENHPSDLRELFQAALPLPQKFVAQKKPVRTRKAQSVTLALLDNAKSFAKVLPDFKPRPAQQEFAAVVAQRLAGERDTLIEVAPGTGRSLAWLVAALHTAQQQEKRVLAVVPSRTLAGAQLKADVAALHSVANLDDLAVLFASNAYLCPRRLAAFLQNPDLKAQEITFAIKILLWQKRTQTGDLHELALMHEEHTARNAVSGSAACATCPDETCFVRRAEEQAQKSSLLLIDYRRLAQALHNRDWLLQTTIVLFDGADEAEATMREALHVQLTGDGLLGALDQAIQRSERGGEAQKALQAAHDKAVLFFGMLGIFLKRFSKPDTFIIEMVIDAALRKNEEWQRLVDVAERLTQLIDDAVALSNENDYLDVIRQDAVATLKKYSAELARFFAQETTNTVEWVTLLQDGSFELHLVPASVAPYLEQQLYPVATVVALAQSIVFEGSANYLASRLGMNEFDLVVTPSVHDYHAQGLILTASDLPGVQHPQYFKHVADVISALAKTKPRRMLVLSPSYASNKTLYEFVKPQIADLSVELLAQSVSGGRHKIAARAAKQQHAVILGTMQFWKDLELFSDTFDIMVLVKFPFENPNAPLVVASSGQYDNAFADYVLPKMALQLKNHFYRLVRSSTQRGVFVLLDPRATTTQYGKQLLAALPSNNVRSVQATQLAQESVSWLSTGNVEK